MFVMLLSVLVALNLGRPLVPWTIVEVNGEDQTFLTLFEKLQAGCFDAVEVCDDLKRAVLLRTFAGAKMETLMVASSGQSVLRVCAQFGNYVKFVVELPELKDPEPVLLPDAFAITQRRLQLGDNALDSQKQRSDALNIFLC